MESNKTFSKREIQKILKANGFVYVGTHGNRQKYKRGKEFIVINPDCNKIIFQRLIKEHCLNV